MSGSSFFALVGLVALCITAFVLADLYTQRYLAQHGQCHVYVTLPGADHALAVYEKCK